MRKKNRTPPPAFATKRRTWEKNHYVMLFDDQLDSPAYLLNGTWSETFTVRMNGEIVDLTSKPADEGIKLGGLKVFKLDNDLNRNEA